MDNINDLVGDAAKQLMAQADGIQNPRLKESAKRVALTVSAKTRDETITKARNAAFARIPIWAFFLPVTRRQQIVLGRIYSFQCTTNKDGSPAEYRMSLSTGASELGMTNRAEMQKDLQRLISLGFVTKRSREDARITDTMNEFTWFMGRRYKLVDAADHIGYEWTGRAHGSLADALATLAVQRWLEQWLVAE